MDPNTPETATAPQEPAQAPVEGQGQPQANGLYPDLSGVPDAVRDAVMPLLKEYEGNVTKKFQEAAEFRKQWEPYGELGINDVQPDELQELLAFRQIAQDPEQFREWHQAVAEELGFNQDPGETPESGEPDFKSLIAEALDERLGPIEQAYQSQQESTALQQAETFINTKLDELAAEHGEFDRDAVCQLALAYDNQPDALERAHKDYSRLIGAAEKNLLDGKLNQPETPQQGGQPPSSVPQVKTFEQAKAAARQMVAQSMTT